MSAASLQRGLDVACSPAFLPPFFPSVHNPAVLNLNGAVYRRLTKIHCMRLRDRNEVGLSRGERSHFHLEAEPKQHPLAVRVSDRGTLVSVLALLVLKQLSLSPSLSPSHDLLLPIRAKVYDHPPQASKQASKQLLCSSLIHGKYKRERERESGSGRKEGKIKRVLKGGRRVLCSVAEASCHSYPILFCLF